MKRIKIFKAYFVLWLFVYFVIVSNLEVFSEFFLSTLTFNVAIVSILAIGSFMIFKGSKDLTMITGTFGVLMYKKRDLLKHIEGIEKNFPSNIANKIKARVDTGVLLFTPNDKDEILAWIDEKFNNQNRYNNFFIGTVLMIGLLGTFTGLLGSIGSMAEIVSSLAGGDVDIGKIMANFSGPLGSMAVGFGSSLFGVISAILLSIKGYLLNKAQATLLDGVENWLNEKTLESFDESGSASLVSSNTLANKSKSFMDIFLEQTSSLNQEIRELSQTNIEFKRALLMMAGEIMDANSKQRELLSSIKDSLDGVIENSKESHQITNRSFEKLENFSKNTERSLRAILNGSYKSIERSDLLRESLMEDSENRKIEFFQLLESIERANRDSRSSDNKDTIDKHSISNIKESIS